jgi:hypothetical protein
VFDVVPWGEWNAQNFEDVKTLIIKLRKVIFNTFNTCP